MPIYETKAPEGSTQKNFQQAVRTIRANGVKWALNVQACCRSCAEPAARWEGKKDWVKGTTPYGWTFGGGKDRLVWLNGEAAQMRYSSYHQKMVKEPLSEAQVLYINHSNNSASVIADAFRLYGFEVEWNGQDYQTVMVTIPAG
jgi:hypothetical protein